MDIKELILKENNAYKKLYVGKLMLGNDECQYISRIRAYTKHTLHELSENCYVIYLSNTPTSKEEIKEYYIVMQSDVSMVLFTTSEHNTVSNDLAGGGKFGETVNSSNLPATDSGIQRKVQPYPR